MSSIWLCIAVMMSTVCFSQRKLAATEIFHDDGKLAGNTYLFDSAFFIGEKDMHRFRLFRNVEEMQYVAISDVDGFFCIDSKRVTILNGTLINKARPFFDLSTCNQKNIEIINGRALRKKYGLDNPGGAFVISCDTSL
jgi:hypothetical protein